MMPLERKPLFNQRLLHMRLDNYQVPEPLNTKLAAVQRWRTTLGSGWLVEAKGTQLQGIFLTDFFQTILGYRDLTEGADHWTYDREVRADADGKTADGALGYFTPTQRSYSAAIELKGAGTDLDARASGQRWTAVEQAYQYAVNLECNWIIVSNYREIRLYHKNRSQQHYELFKLNELADAAAFKRFCYLFSASHVIARDGASVIDRLLADTGAEEQRVTHLLYAEYKQLRLQVLDELRRYNPGRSDLFLLEKTQKLLDRILFICFCEDRGLLPDRIIDRAYTEKNPFAPQPIWRNFIGLFRAIDAGHEQLRIPAYDGGLFAPDEELESLAVSDNACGLFRQLGKYDYAAEVNVDVLGHIFEQSISDIEDLKSELSGQTAGQKTAKRKRGGVFYTPEYITRFIVERVIGTHLRERFAALWSESGIDAIPSAHTRIRTKAEIDIWQTFHKILERTRVLDPACGSGAFLIQACDFLAREYDRCNARLAELEERVHQPDFFDLNRQVLRNNLYGVDINREAVEITKLSLWIKTAEWDKQLTDLDSTIKEGNSLLSPPDGLDAAADTRRDFRLAFATLPDNMQASAFDWRSVFPAVFADGGFDCIIGNPPYIRQEWLGPYKPLFQQSYDSYASTADIYLYFFERGMQLLKPGGRLGYITSGTFARAAFAKPFRAWLPKAARFEALLNFGENQPFADAEMVYPTISILVKDPGPPSFKALLIQDRIPASLGEALEESGALCESLPADGSEWRFQRNGLAELSQRLFNSGASLGAFVKDQIFYGIKTGLNEAFCIDSAARDKLLAADPRSGELIKKVMSGEDLRSWYHEDSGRWLLFFPNGWTRQRCGGWTETEAWAWLEHEYPAVTGHLVQFESAARQRQDKGEFWWELRACDYYEALESPKIVWPDIAKLPRFSYDASGSYVFNTGYAMPAAELWLLALLQSRVMWFCIAQIATPLRLRAGLWQYRCIRQFIERLPVIEPAAAEKQALSALAAQATAIAQERYALHERTRHRILTDLAGENRALNQKLTAYWTLDFPSFRAEVAKALKRDIPVRERADWEQSLAEWRNLHTALTQQLTAAEEELNRRIYQLYGLSEQDIDLLGKHGRQAQIWYPLGEV